MQDIVSTLRIQVAHLFYRMLKLKKQFDTAKLSDMPLQTLKGGALRLLLEKPFAWDYKIFGQVYQDGLKELQNLKRDYKYGISLEKSKRLADFQEILNWIQEKINDFSIMMENISDLINVRLKEALKEPGVPADIEYVVYVAEKIVEIYKKVLQIGIEVKFITVDDQFKELVKIPIEICNSILNDIENFCDTYQENMNNLKEGEKNTIQITLNMGTPSLDGFHRELNKVKKMNGLQ